MPKLLAISFYPNKLLTTKANFIEVIDDSIRELAKDMLLTMYENKGIGLAANQVGVLKQLIVIDLQKDEFRQPLILINPKILNKSQELSSYEEGCLSLPFVKAEIQRPAIIEIFYLDLENNEHTLQVEGLLATCIQHEVDHLNGILFFKHLSKLKKDLLLKTYNKERKANKNKGIELKTPTAEHSE